MTAMTAPVRIRILTVDDHPLFREGVAAMIEAQADMELVAQAADGEEGIRQFRSVKPDITLMDVRLPDMSGIDALIALCSEFVEARIIMLSTSQGDMEIRRAMEAGARGFLLKSMPAKDILTAIRWVHNGRKYMAPEVGSHLAEYFTSEALTNREVQILKLVASGKRNRDVAHVLSITEETVKVHMKHIMDKLGAHDRAEAVMIAVRRGVIWV
jgi:DNA-binding NarL/FixJ family response regulator